jgi:hypothetical protein
MRASERRALTADHAAQEQGAAEVTTPRVARDYVHALHPETGLEVTFVHGETLPEWVPDALLALGREARDGLIGESS